MRSLLAFLILTLIFLLPTTGEILASGRNGSQCTGNCSLRVSQEEQFKEMAELIPAPSVERCGGGADPSRVRECGFNNLIAQARARGGCSDETLREVACENSPFQNLNFSERISAILNRAAPIARAYGIDPRVMVCIAARETEFLEPLRISPLACAGQSQWGLSAMIRPTFRGLMTNEEHFLDRDASCRPNCGTPNYFRMPPYFLPITQANPASGRRYTESERVAAADLAQDAMALNVDFQLEAMAAAIREKFGESTSYRQMLVKYNGSIHKEAYASAVHSCFTCLGGGQRRDLNMRDFPITACDPASCMNRVYPTGNRRAPYRDLREQFKIFQEQSCPNGGESVISRGDPIPEACSRPAREQSPRVPVVTPVRGTSPPPVPQRRG